MVEDNEVYVVTIEDGATWRSNQGVTLADEQRLVLVSEPNFVEIYQGYRRQESALPFGRRRATALHDHDAGPRLGGAG